MVKQRSKFTAKRPRTKLNQLQRKLSPAVEIQNDKLTRSKQFWWKTPKRCYERPPQIHFSHYKTSDLLYKRAHEEGTRHGPKQKFKERLESPKQFVIFKENLGVRNAKNNFGLYEDSNRGFKFHLKDGRVDVPQVLKNLGLTKLQYEHKPGVWRALKGLSSGESVDKFQNNQEVHVRADINKPSPGVRKEYNWLDSWLVENDTEEAYNARVSRIVQNTGKGRIGVGTMVRVNTPLIPGLMLTCRHCVELNENGSINEKLLAFGGPVTILYVSNKYDLALCEGPPGNDGFRLATEGEEVKGREIRMLSFPWHVDLVYGLHEDMGPTQVHGNVCMFSPQGCEMPMEVDALGTYMGGFPASSGGAVTLNSKVLCGIHVGVIWHDKDELSMPLVLGSKGHVESHRNRFHMQLCAKHRKAEQHSCSTNDPGQLQVPLNYCSSSHGYLATYVSSCHIEEVFQDYLESIRVLDSKTD